MYYYYQTTINMQRERLNNLKHPDDTLLFSQDEIELVNILWVLQTSASKIGLEMNISQTV